VFRTILFAAVALIAAQTPMFADDDHSAKQLDMAKTLVAQMAAGHFDKAVEPFDPTMTSALPSNKSKEVWDGLTKQHGLFRRANETTMEKVQQYEVVYVTCEFQRGKLDTKVVFTSENKITGLFFVPSGRYKPPSYADASRFEEKEVSIGKGIWRLPGTLSIPKGAGPFSCVILVHGSGPHDRDETIGPNKPFRDLAHGLASRGIAVFRYEKRTKHHQIMMALSVNTITVKEETVDDVVAAVEALASEEKIDPKRIFVLGHSLGGMLIPRIGKANPKIAGFISLAGSTRPLEDLMLEQTKYILSLDGTMSQEAHTKLKEIEQQVARVKSAQLSKDTSTTELPLGVPANYWLDLRGYNPGNAAKELSKPIQVLQGERDYQVTMEDFTNWKEALRSRKDVIFISYPKLNHLFVEGEGKSTPAEYSTPGNVATVVIEDIAKWIKDDTGWTSLFNGKSLDGWVVKCRPEDKDKTGYWKVVDGTITAETPPGSKHNYMWLMTEKEYDDFELTLKIQTFSKSTGNSGIQVRSRYDDHALWLDGPQVDIHPPGPWRCGFIYDETREAGIWLWPDVGDPANAKPSHAPKGWKWFHSDNQEVWNDVYIVCRGTKIKSVINGVTIADYDGAGRLDDEAHHKHNVGMKGQIGLQIHPGGELLIRFKDIVVQKVK